MNYFNYLYAAHELFQLFIRSTWIISIIYTQHMNISIIYTQHMNYFNYLYAAHELFQLFIRST